MIEELKYPRGAKSGRRAEYAWLGESLRLLFQAYVDEPLPDTFRQLLEDLEKKDELNGRGQSGSGKPP